MSEATAKTATTETNRKEGDSSMIKVAGNIAVLNQKMLDDGLTVGDGISALAQAVKRRHGQYARTELGKAVFDAYHKGGLSPLEKAWQHIIENLEKEHKAYGHTLLAHPRVSNQQVRQLQMSPIVVGVGEARTLQPIESFQDLRTVLRTETGLRDKLYEEGQDAHFAEDARTIWAEMPNGLKAAVIDRMTDPTFADVEKQAFVKGRKVKASGVKGIEALEKPDAATWWAARAGTWCVRILFQLSFRYANSAAFWADIIRPTPAWDKDRTGQTSSEDEVYPGEERKSYEGPFSTFTPGGSTLGEIHDDTIRCIDAVQAEFEEAAQMAEQWMERLQQAAAKVGIETPYHFIRNNDGSFTEITDLDEAIELLQAKERERQEQRALKEAKMAGGETTFNNRDEARQELLDQITDPEAKKQVEAELVRAGGEA